MQLNHSECRERLEVSPFGVLGTVDSNRGTHLVPVVFAVSGDELVVPIDTVKPKGTKQLRRVRNLQSDSRASILIDHQSTDWNELWWVRADLEFRGVVANEDAWQTRLAMRYPQYSDPVTIDSLLHFALDSITGWAAR
ncbi:MAG: pyridoxamine 5'-phosphate oxidase family protein [Acidimicrobiia bacterium]